MKKFLFLAIAILMFGNLSAEPKVFSVQNVAIGGVDVVAYFTTGQPTMGLDYYITEWQGTTWQFSSRENLALFNKDPTRFAPQFGGFCSLTTAHGASIPINPMAWTIHNQRLYLFVFEAARDTWLMNPDKLIERANLAWSSELSK
jgi:hypothetical protein